MLLTSAHPCGYWPERSARNLVHDGSGTSIADTYPRLLAAGFRRSGAAVYRPRCDSCTACVPVRIPVADFRPARAQRRCLSRNADLTPTLESARVDDAVLALYQRYVDARHPGSGMRTDDAAAFAEMFLTERVDTRFLCLRRESALMAVAITDVTGAGCSSVYTFFEPDQAHAARGLGTLAILAQIALTRALGLQHLYLGYWLDGHPNMHYKARFRPQQRLQSNGWVEAA